MSSIHEMSLEERIEQMRKQSHSPSSLPKPEPVQKAQKVDYQVQEKDLIEMKEAADRLGVGFKELFTILRIQGHFIKSGKSNVPKSEYIRAKFFVTRMKTFKRSHVENPYIKVFVTSAGMSFLAESIKQYKEHCNG